MHPTERRWRWIVLGRPSIAYASWRGGVGGKRDQFYDGRFRRLIFVSRCARSPCFFIFGDQPLEVDPAERWLVAALISPNLYEAARPGAPVLEAGSVVDR